MRTTCQFCLNLSFFHIVAIYIPSMFFREKAGVVFFKSFLSWDMNAVCDCHQWWMCCFCQRSSGAEAGALHPAAPGFDQQHVWGQYSGEGGLQCGVQTSGPALRSRSGGRGGEDTTEPWPWEAQHHRRSGRHALQTPPAVSDRDQREKPYVSETHACWTALMLNK